MSTCVDEYLPFLLSALINHIVNVAEGDFHGGISNFADVGHDGLKPARLARTPIELSFVVGITVAVLMYFPRFVNQSYRFRLYNNMTRGFVLRVCLIRRTNDKWVRL